MALTIPEDLSKAINPSITHPIKYSHIYTFQEDNPISYGSQYIKLPYTANLYWTHFRPNWIGKGCVKFELHWHYNGKSEVEFPCITSCKNGEWQAFNWPLPSVDTQEDAGFYLRVFYPDIHLTGFLQINFLGFEQLMPYYKSHFIFCDTDRIPKHVLCTSDPHFQSYYLTVPDIIPVEDCSNYHYIQTQNNYLADKVLADKVLADKVLADNMPA